MVLLIILPNLSRQAARLPACSALTSSAAESVASPDARALAWTQSGACPSVHCLLSTASSHHHVSLSSPRRVSPPSTGPIDSPLFTFKDLDTPSFYIFLLNFYYTQLLPLRLSSHSSSLDDHNAE